MTQTMKAAVVHAFGEPLRIEEVPVPTPGPARSSSTSRRRACAIPTCTQPMATGRSSRRCRSFPGMKAWASSRRSVRASRTCARGSRGRAVVLHGLRPLRVLPHGLGNAVPRPAEHRLFGERQLRGIRAGRPRLRRPFARAGCVRRDRADPVRGCHRLQGHSRHRYAPGQWLAISGIGGLGHVAVQYARAMGLHVAAIDISPDKLALARQLGAELTIDASIDDPAKVIQKEIGGAHGVLVTAVSRSAFAQALGMVRRGGTVALNGLPPGDFRCRSSRPC